ncbi:cytochrome P450 [Xylaria bambusicola]|uniref:cytochrome P450 n=1 Tax=Xylaria bambusicola TaxID=326684 RepID=UPI00200868E1|nr:cytochrome P450 [Xylaria bambusicola]KAI0502862.1 cytochrome P450 [Xylaria bambusicola]
MGNPTIGHIASIIPSIVPFGLAGTGLALGILFVLLTLRNSQGITALHFTLQHSKVRNGLNGPFLYCLGALQAPFLFVVSRARAWEYLFRGTVIIQEAFDKANGQPFEVLTPDNRCVFVTSAKHIKELDTAPDTVLSLQAASKQMLQPNATMCGFNWFDRRGTEGVGFIRALRTLLTNNLPEILPDLGTIVSVRLDELLSESPVMDGQRQSQVYPIIIKLVVLSNAVSFFGKDLAKNEEFMNSALAYIEETLICAEVIRLVPKRIAGLLGGVVSRRLRSQRVIFDTLLPVAEQRCLEREQKKLGQTVPHHADCIQWIMETSPTQKPWSATRIVHELMAIWFGSVHALSTTITFAIHDLCLHPEYVEPLRAELFHGHGSFTHTAQGLPLLDSFIKESARLTPVESMSTRRAALMPFTLSDGTTVNVGDWVCTPVRAIMQHAELYPEALAFNGFRFVDESCVDIKPGIFKVLQPQPSKLTDADNTWHVWGTGRMTCPGRFYAVAVMKVILGEIILNYDCDLPDKETRRYLSWRSTILPKRKTTVVFIPRQVI